MRTDSDSPTEDMDNEYHPHDAEAEPDDLEAMEQSLSGTTEEGCCDQMAGLDPDPMAELEPDHAWDDEVNAEMERYCMGEPEPPEEDAK